MAKPIPLDEQIVATLTGECTSDQAANVLTLAERLMADLVKQADAADVASLNPLATSTEAHALRRSASDQRFDADRMEASVSALRARLADLKDAERRGREKAAYDAAIRVRDELAAEIATEYPAIVHRLTALAKRIVASDELCRVNRITETAEALGRGIPANFYDKNAPIMRITEAKLPMPQGHRLAWGANFGQPSEGWFWYGLDAVSPSKTEAEAA